MKLIFIYAIIFTCFISQLQSANTFEPVSGFNLDENRWEIKGNAEKIEEGIILAKEIGETGLITNNKKLNFEGNSYHILVTFDIDFTKAKGDGLGIWFTESEPLPGDMFGGPRTWNGAVVVLDSIINNERNPIKAPTLTIHRNDGTGISSVETDGDNTLASYCITQIRYGILRLNIVYADNILTVFTDMDGKNQWRECASFPIRLKDFFVSVSASNKQSAGRYLLSSIQVQKVTLNNNENDNQNNNFNPKYYNNNNNNNNNNEEIKNNNNNNFNLKNVPNFARMRRGKFSTQRINQLRTSLYIALNNFNMILGRYANDTIARLPQIESAVALSREQTEATIKGHKNQDQAVKKLGDRLIPSIQDQLKNRRGKAETIIRDIDAVLLAVDNHLVASLERIPKFKFVEDPDEIAKDLNIPMFFIVLGSLIPIIPIVGCCVWFFKKPSASNNKRAY